MNRITCFIVFLCITAGAQTGQSQAPIMRRVTALFTATDSSGSPVQNMKADGFAVTDNDTAGKILDIRSAEILPLRVAFLLEASKANFPEQQRAAIEIARKAMRPNVDRAFVVSAGGIKPWPSARVEWLNDPSALEKTVLAMDRNSGMPDPFAFDINQAKVGEGMRLILVQYGTTGTSVFDVLWAMMKSDPTPARHVVIAFRDPWAHSPGFDRHYTEVVETNHQRLIADAQRLWTPFFVITAEQPLPAHTSLTQTYAPTFAGQGEANREFDESLDKARTHAYNGGRVNLERIAAETGGQVWWSVKKNYPDAVEAVVRKLSGQFAISYEVPIGTGTETAHNLQIRTADSKVRLGVQKVYFSRVSSQMNQATAPPSPQAVQPAPKQ